MTKTGTGQGITKTFTKDAPVESGYYWVKRFVDGHLMIEPACIFENDRLSWGSVWKIKFIGDNYDYTLPMVEQMFELTYGGRCL
jgi:hypothetical protein